MRVDTGLKYQPVSFVNLKAGVSVDGVYDNAPAMKFMHDSGVRVGEYVEGDVNLYKNAHLFGRVQMGGVQNEPVYMVGVTFGGGSKPWLDPLFR